MPTTYLWQEFVRTFDDAEAAGVALLILIGSVFSSVALFVHWLTVGRYDAALCLVTVLGTVTGVCVRDYRRGKWSILSTVVVGVWVVLAFSALAFVIWFSYAKG